MGADTGGATGGGGMLGGMFGGGESLSGTGPSASSSTDILSRVGEFFKNTGKSAGSAVSGAVKDAGGNPVMAFVDSVIAPAVRTGGAAVGELTGFRALQRRADAMRLEELVATDPTLANNPHFRSVLKKGLGYSDEALNELGNRALGDDMYRGFERLFGGGGGGGELATDPTKFSMDEYNAIPQGIRRPIDQVDSNNVQLTSAEQGKLQPKLRPQQQMQLGPSRPSMANTIISQLPAGSSVNLPLGRVGKRVVTTTLKGLSAADRQGAEWEQTFNNARDSFMASNSLDPENPQHLQLGNDHALRATGGRMPGSVPNALQDRYNTLIGQVGAKVGQATRAREEAALPYVGPKAESGALGRLRAQHSPVYEGSGNVPIPGQAPPSADQPAATFLPSGSADFAPFKDILAQDTPFEIGGKNVIFKKGTQVQVAPYANDQVQFRFPDGRTTYLPRSAIGSQNPPDVQPVASPGPPGETYAERELRLKHEAKATANENAPIAPEDLPTWFDKDGVPLQHSPKYKPGMSVAEARKVGVQVPAQAIEVYRGMQGSLQYLKQWSNAAKVLHTTDDSKVSAVNAAKYYLDYKTKGLLPTGIDDKTRSSVTTMVELENNLLSFLRSALNEKGNLAARIIDKAGLSGPALWDLKTVSKARVKFMGALLAASMEGTGVPMTPELRGYFEDIDALGKKLGVDKKMPEIKDGKIKDAIGKLPGWQAVPAPVGGPATPAPAGREGYEPDPDVPGLWRKVQ